MSGFGDMMMDDGFSDEMDYMDSMEDRWERQCDEDLDRQLYDEKMKEDGYEFFNGSYWLISDVDNFLEEESKRREEENSNLDF